MKKLILLFAIGSVLVSAQEVGAKYLIITHDNFYNAVVPLAEWKHKKGMRTKVFKTSETGSSATAIRTFIANAYNTWQIQPEYLLLVGAPNYITFPQVSGTFSDNYYTNMDGDIYNEILSGRLTVHNTTEAQTVVKKILTYERTPYMSDPDWFKKACLIARMGGDSDDTIYWNDTYYAANRMATNGYVTIDTLSNQYGHNASTVISRVNSGRSIIMYRGAGVNNWYSPFNVEPSQTQNGERLPIVLSLTCRTIGTSSTPAVAEQWLLTGTPTTPRGGAGYFATTTTVYDQAYLRSAVAYGFFDGVFVNDQRTFGKACEAGRLRVYQMYQYQGGDDEYYGFTTLGDPEMNLWTASPRLLAVNHESSLDVGADTLNVTVLYQGTPVEDAQVCACMQDTVVYEVGYTDVNGSITFPLDLPQPGDLDLTVTGDNLHPYEATIPVITGGVHLAYLNHNCDDSFGNDNGIVQNGELILLWVTIENVGTILAQDVSATIHSPDTHLVLIDTLSYYGNISPQTSSSHLTPYVFSVSPQSPTHTATFEIEMTDIYDNTWLDNFTIQIQGVGGGSGGEIGPDPYGYYIYDDTDTLTGIAPQYNWLEIAPPAGGQGIIITPITNDDDDTVSVSLPFSFKYYGITYNSIGICTNAFLELNRSTTTTPSNTVIPAAGNPRRFLAPFWDNLNPGTHHMGHGDIYQYYDAANHRWIMEFYQVAHRGMGGGSQWETFQAILLDPGYYPTPTGDGEILYQYLVVTNSASNTVGMEDHTESRGLQYVFNNSYDQNAAPLAPGRAILITTRPPLTGETSPWLYIVNYTVDDSTGGNGNGIVEPNETISITVTLENGGDTLASNVTGILRLDDTDAVITDSIASFGNIVVGGSAHNAGDEYILTVDPVPADSTINCILYLNANNDTYETFNYFSLYIAMQPGIEDERNSNDQRKSRMTLSVSPNPFSQKTTIHFSAPDCEYASVVIYDVTGRKVYRFISSGNTGEFTWFGCDGQGMTVPSGIYFAQLESERENSIRKFIFLK